MTPMRVALAALSLLVFAPAALADVPPPPGYVEQCTIAKQKKAGEECVSCGAAYFREPDACQKLYEGQGYDRRCKTRGASTWDEVWCRKKGAKPTPPSDGAVTPPAPTPAPTPIDDETPTRPLIGDPPPAPPAAEDPPPAPTADEAPPTPAHPTIGDPPPAPPEPPPSATTPPEAPAPPAVRDEPPPPEKKKSSCAGGPVTTSMGLALAALFLVLRRRSRRA